MIEKEIFNALTVGEEAIKFISRELCRGNKKEISLLLDNLNELVSQIERFIEINKGTLLSTIVLYCKNIKASIESISNRNFSINNIFFLEIRPFFLEIKRLFELEYNIIQKKENWESYRQKLMEGIKDSKNFEDRKHRYKVSIIFLAYNKLEYTKIAIESIYKYTDFSHGDIELITINNGSTDDTAEYLNSLSNTKKINLKYNILGTAAYFYNIEGKYWVGFSNDVVATPHWLDNLVKCMDEQKDVAMAVPTCNGDAISNTQGIDVPYRNQFDDMDKMEQFAIKYNKCSSVLWEERPVLMPFLHISRTSLFEKFIIDCLYTQGEFVDDDLATSLRRAGFKQILAKDTFMHHFGSVTLGSERKEKQSLENMRKVYFDKWGVDAWESRAIWPGLEECLQKENIFLKKNMSLLFFEPKFGGSFLQFKNYYRQKECFFDNNMAAVIDQRYIDDAMGLFDEVVTGDKAIDTISSINKVFDIISSGVFLSELGQNNVIEFLEKAYTKLKPGGIMIFPIRNYRNVKIIMQLLLEGGVSSYDKKSYEFFGCSIRKLIENLRQHSYLCNCRIHFIPDGMNPFTREIAEIFEKQRGLLSKENRNELYMELNSSYAIICISKL